jgi:hypothetical protein
MQDMDRQSSTLHIVRDTTEKIMKAGVYKLCKYQDPYKENAMLILEISCIGRKCPKL